MAPLARREWVAGWAQDLRLASRQFRRSPGFAAVTVLVLGLGIGAATAIFTVVRGVLLRPLPYPEADRIIQAWEIKHGGGRMSFADPNFDDLREGARSFIGLAEFSHNGTESVSGDVAAVRASLDLVSHDFFAVLQVRPVLGRTFAPDEERAGAPLTAVLSWGFWQRTLGGTRDALGKRLRIGDRTYTIIGVMEPMLDLPAGTDIWVPREPIFPHLPSRAAHNFQVVGRLRSGVTLAAAQREVTAIARRLAARYGSDTMMEDAALVPLRDQLVATARPTLLVLFCASAVLLVIACANVANLLVARLTAQQAELAVRVALGASSGRLIRQCLSESLLLATGGGILGVILAAAGTHALLGIDPTRLPRAADVHVDSLVLFFALGTMVTTALALAILTGWRASQSDARNVIGASSRTVFGSAASTRLRQILVAGQVAMTMVLLIAAGLLGRTFVALLSVDPGFRSEGRAVLDLAIAASDSASEMHRAQFFHELLSRLSGLPGLAAVGAANAIPLDGGAPDGFFIELSAPDEQLSPDDLARLGRDPARSADAEFRVASSGYFAAMHIPVLEGRLFDERDRPDAPIDVAVVSASLANARWRGQTPIGKWVQFGNMDGDPRPFVIIGVVGDVREYGLGALPRPTFYADYLQRPVSTKHMDVVLATAGDPIPVAATAQRLVRALRPDVPPRVRTMNSIVAASVAGQRLALILVGAFGAAALVLAACGLYGVISYMVAQRALELSVRAALGASRRDIVGLVLRDGSAVTLAGVLVGGLGAFAVARLIARLLYGVRPADPITFVGVVALVTLVALIASWIPANRASRKEPVVALRG